MARTTIDNVEAIIDVDSGISLAPFIEVANALVTEKCAAVDTYDDTRLELIERWLAAHFYHIRSPQPASDKADEVTRVFQQKVDLGFNQTRYGQQALLLDTNGGLAALNAAVIKGKPKTVSVTWLGKTRTELKSSESIDN